MSDSNTPLFQNGTPAPNSTLSLTSLIMGILGWSVIPIVGAIIAVITGHMSKKEIRESNGSLGGDGMATAGLLLGYSNLALGLCVCLAFILFPALLLGFFAAAEGIFNTIP
ncbi:MAG: DUF4190 domain-containing protein [Chloroflexota bacterium]